MVGLLDGAAEFPGIYTTVQPVVVFGVAQKDKVVDGDNAPDATLAYADGQFARQSVKHLNAVAAEVIHYPPAAPQSLAQRCGGSFGKVECHIVALHHLGAQVLATFVGSIEMQMQGKLSQVVDQRASVAAQSCAVAHNTLGVEPDNGIFIAHAHHDIAIEWQSYEKMYNVQCPMLIFYYLCIHNS